MSRRQRKRQLGFETLEDRRVMSADSPLAPLQGAVSDDIQFQVQSLSSSSAAGQQQILLNELYWQSLQTGTVQSQSVSTASIPTDPLLSSQWQLINTGQQVGNPDFQNIFATPGEDINVAPVWNQGITGAGVTVAVVDSGVEKTHPDLAANIDPTLELDALTGDGDASPDISVFDPTVESFNQYINRSGINAHGTAVAGLIGAVADNGIGGTGVAPGVDLVPIRLIDTGQTEQAFIDTFRFATDQIDITNNSWGPTVTRGIAGPTANELLALRDSVTFGRDGLGVIHVFAAGNDASSPFSEGFQNSLPGQGPLDSATYNGWVGSRYTIGVTGVDHDGFYNNADGTVTSYPETGANVLVAAPTGSTALSLGSDTGVGSGIVTTDTTGNTGFNVAPDAASGQEFDRDFQANTDFTSRFNGTSASTPLVSGVIALMLEANPNLSWRDVQEILVRSARQNAEFGVPTATGVTFANSGTTQNTWIVNQTPVFSDPDPFDPLINPSVLTLTPTVIPKPIVLTNGAGYTVSQGRGVYGEEIGSAHGVVDAELAVQLAQQWTTKNQTLPDELTYTSNVTPNGLFFINLPAAEQSNAASGRQIIPGGLFGISGFKAFWDEYFATNPFSGTTSPGNTRAIPVSLSVPDSNNMNVETVELKVSIAGGTTAALDSLRILLISPDGTQSELNDYFIDDSFRDPANPPSLQNDSPATFFTGGGINSTDTNPGGNLVATFTTNRNWGERSDNAFVFDPTTAEPVGTQGWQIVMENYSPTNLRVDGLEVIWHGSPIGANTQRVQGLIGVDDNRDDAFNFSRVIQNNSDTDGVIRFGEVTNTVDQTHESMGANVTVTARRASDGVVVDQFVTGADGNYYFDLVPDDYIISIDDPLGRTTLDDTFTDSSKFLQDYKTEWTISSDFFKVWDYDANLEVSVQADGITPLALLDGNGNEITDGVKNLNFLLDPGPAAAPEVNFSGVVTADINGDGIFNTGDINVPGVSVFGDVNRNGQFDTGEVIVSTNISGEYSLTIPLDPALSSAVVNVGVIAPANWSLSDPAAGFKSFLVNQGDSISTNTDFTITPPAGEGPGNGTNQDGYLLGVVFVDSSSDGQLQSDELGQVGVDVFLDSNGSGSFDAGERITATNSNGAFIFQGVAQGIQVVKIETAGTPFTQTFPLADGPQVVNLSGGGTVSNILFGLLGTNIGGGGDGAGTVTATLDFGDLPAQYGATLFAENGARHAVGVYFLGSSASESIDAEINGLPSPDALGDDSDNFDDEDGIVVDELVEGTTGRLVATASLYGGYLQGWVDFNGDADFDEAGERILTNVPLVPGPNELFFDIPATLTSGDVFARFRYGEYGIDSIKGAALIGEVEDYKLAKAAPLVVALHGPDFNEDGNVDGFDFLSWQLGYGMNGGAVLASNGDSNSDAAVNTADYVDWSTEFGGGTVAASAPATGDYDADGDTDGVDFLTWQTGFGSASAAVALGSGDGNNNSSVDAEDFSVWSDNFGQSTSTAPLAASVGSPGEPGLAPIIAAAQAPSPLSVSSLSAATASFSASNTYATLSTTSTTPVAVSQVTATPVASSQAETATLTGENTLTGARQAALASLATRLIPSGNLGQTRLARPNLPRFETLASEARVDRAFDVEELGREVQDRVLDQRQGRRQSLTELPGEQSRDDENVSAAALSVALGEEIEWRFF